MSARDNVALLTDTNLEQGLGDKTAIVTHDGDSLTYADVHAVACRVGAHLREIGVRRGERVLLVLDDTPAFHACFLGAIRIGAVPVPTNFLARPSDVGYMLDDSYAVAAVVDTAFLGSFAPEVERRGVTLIVANGPAPAEAHSLDGWMTEGDPELAPVTSHPEDPAFWLYSSGSTGLPKGVIHLQHDVADTCENYAVAVLGLRRDDVGFSTTKLFHAYGLGNGLTFPMWVGATQVQLVGRPTPQAALETIARRRPTVLYSVPTLFNAMLHHPSFASSDLSSVRISISAAEPLPAEVWKRWYERTGTEILDGIGSTEMLHIYCSNRPGHCVPGASGRPVPGYELQLRDESGVLLDGEAEGELYVKGESALDGYWHRQDKTRTSLVGEWFRSGDRYRRDADGVYWYAGRVDDMMKVSGLWVSPIEIENRLIEHPNVAEAAVVSVQPDGLTRIRAVVVPREDAEPDERLIGELQQWCKQGLQRYQFPHEVRFVEDLPRTATGKIQRFKLRE